MSFDPEGTFSVDSGVFGLPKDPEGAKVHLLPLAWEPTTSFKKGTAKGPQALFEASKQMDLYHPYFRKTYEKGVFWQDFILKKSEDLNKRISPKADQVISALESGQTADSNLITEVNEASEDLNHLVYNESLSLIEQNKKLGLIGGDHSSPFGLIQALNEKHSGEFSIVHLDAHFDFRKAYQGFEHSHASIMYNVRTQIENPPEIFQLGVRDFCESELLFAQKNSQFILDSEMSKMLLSGKSFHQILEKFFEGLKEKIYISLDIDGLSPEHCPNTGTPVPGGLSYAQAAHLISFLHERGHRLIGFDLVEVAPNMELPLGEGLDEVTAVRLMYALSCFAACT